MKVTALLHLHRAAMGAVSGKPGTPAMPVAHCTSAPE